MECRCKVPRALRSLAYKVHMIIDMMFRQNDGAVLG